MNDVKFAAQQLSKKEMNEVKGGIWFKCVCTKELNKTWTANYIGTEKERTDAMNADMRKICGIGGECRQISMS